MRPRCSTAMARFRRRWRSVWCGARWPITGRWRRCGGCIGTPRADRWWRWSRDRGCSRRVWPDSSACGTAPVAPRTVMRRFGIGITPHRATAAGRPVPPMGWASANGATTPKKRRAGASPRETKTVRTQPTSSRPPVPGIGRQRHRYQGHHWSRQAKSKSESALHWPTYTRPRR